MLSGCGSSISQEDYDAKVSELETLQKNYNLKENELETLQQKYNATETKLKTVQKELAKSKTENTDKDTQEIKNTPLPEKSNTENNVKTTTGTPETTPLNENSGNISPDKFIEDVKNVTQNAIGENESIKDIRFDNADLQIYVDLNQTDTSLLESKDIAFTRTSSITDEILALSEYESMWNTITVDFGELGCIRNGKDNIKNDGFGPYFSSVDFELE